MRTEGCSVDSFNLAFAIKSCIGLSILQYGKLVHCLAIKLGLDRDPYLVPALIDVYSDLGSLKDAHKLFEEIPEWNTVIWDFMMKGYLKSSEQTKVFELFSEMRTAGFELEPFTSECLVWTCGNVFAGKEVSHCGAVSNCRTSELPSPHCANKHFTTNQYDQITALRHETRHQRKLNSAYTNKIKVKQNHKV
ncbi:Pentatricopeptide repeat-containing protein [Camellia lanceoleosa]|uniref:Pentatricopeptide repeat-containing protein n=1 Tax=Camellia lanceoleosa TaxID=1840588 RepID=A0ACC0H597_9ERIC|nr:Pentatricopeptide repeat-containing protein [Camellia lanceoleosa]